ncbi:MAG: hypothetical protein FJX48_06860 [Alphaproteobacteria bacterium]|nr:hypothetical protein [Alphaproteobacteria bacterium]
MQEIGCIGHALRPGAIAGRASRRRLKASLSTQTNASTSTKLVEYPFEVRVDEILHDRFHDLTASPCNLRQRTVETCNPRRRPGVAAPDR